MKGHLTVPFLFAGCRYCPLARAAPAGQSVSSGLLVLLDGRFRRCGRLGSTLFGSGSLHRQLDAAAVVGFENLDANDLAFLDVVFDLVDALLGDLGDVQQAILARQNGNDRAEIEDLEHGTFVDLADLDFRRDRIDARTGRAAASPLVAAMVIVPSSWMSIVVPVSSVSARITAPPLPITSRIFSGLILKV
jgi:hypothetical protein